jgi:ABC-type transport system substrate-binding protein
MARRSRDPRLVAVFLAALVAVGAGCMRQADSTVIEDGPHASPRRGGSFHLMIEPPGTLDPSLVDDVYEACLINQLFDGLLEFDVHLNPVPAIAREWSVSRDGLEYVFRLRDDVQFHNGRRVVADDFVFSFARIFGSDRTDYGIGGGYLRKIAGVEDFIGGKSKSIRGLVAENDTTLRIVLEQPYGSFLSALAMDQTKVVAREAIDGVGDGMAIPIGTGPFVWDRRDDATSDPCIVLRANDKFRAGRPHVDEVVFHTPKDYDVDRGAEAIFAGRLTMCDMPAAWRDRFEADARFRIIRRPELSFSFIGFQLQLRPFQDVRVRRALAHAIDRARIAQIDPFGRMLAVGILPPGMFGYSPEDKAIAYDPARARQLLAEAGYPGGKGLPPVLHHQAHRGEAGRAADAIMAENLEAIGVRVEFRYIEWETFSVAIDEKSLPCLGLTWVADVPDPDSFLASLFLTEGTYNMFSYSNAAVDSLLIAGSRMRGSRERADLYRRAERLILDDAPVIPLYNIENAFVVRREVRDLHVTPFGLGNLSMDRVWLDSPAS